MARRNISTAILSPADIAFNADPEKTISLTNAEFNALSAITSYAKGHGPVIYGSKGNRGNIPALDNLFRQLSEKIEAGTHTYASFSAIKNSEEGDKSVTLTGPEMSVVRALIRVVQKSPSLLAVSEEEKDEFDNFASGLMLKV